MMYTFIVGIIMVLLTMCIFTLEINEMKYNISRENYLLNEDYVQKCKEYCFTRLNSYIYDNVETISFESIGSYFDSLVVKDIVTYEEAQIVYNSEQQWLELITPYEKCFHRKDIYKFDVKNNSIKYEYFKTEIY